MILVTPEVEAGASEAQGHLHPQPAPGPPGLQKVSQISKMV